MHMLKRRSSISAGAKRATASISAALLASTSLSSFAEANSGNTKTPIKHVIVIIGENWTFDSLFATYKPVNKGEYVLNLLSKKIVKADGSPGPNYGEALQYKAYNFHKYKFAPPKTPYDPYLPPVPAGGPSTPYVCQALGIASGTQCVTKANIQAAKQYQDGLPDNYYKYLLTGGTGQKSKVPDARINYGGRDASHLPPGPFQITSKTLPYDAYTASPVHRFYQMWQQLDCDAAAADESNGWGCRSDLFPWVGVTVGSNENGRARPKPFNDLTTGEGGTSMGFY